MFSLNAFYEKAGQNPKLGEKLATLSHEYDEKLRALTADEGFELDEVQPLIDEQASAADGGCSVRPATRPSRRLPVIK